MQLTPCPNPQDRKMLERIYAQSVPALATIAEIKAAQQGKPFTKHPEL